ncbi:hypothetical protein MHYP_G00119300 [Metynnis hypsauchen]
MRPFLTRLLVEPQKVQIERPCRYSCAAGLSQCRSSRGPGPDKPVLLPAQTVPRNTRQQAGSWKLAQMHSSLGTQRHKQIPRGSEESQVSPDTIASQVPHHLPREGQHMDQN